MFCCGNVIFSDQEIRNLLSAAGFFPGTQAFAKERARRFMIDPDNTTGRLRFVERDDWDPKDPVQQPIYNEQEVQTLLRQRGFTPGTIQYHNKKYSLFMPTGPGSGEFRWVGESDTMEPQAPPSHNFDVV